MAIVPLCKTVITAGSASEFNTALQASLTATTITTFYGISITIQGGNIIGTYIYA